MSVPTPANETPANDEIARVAHAIWEAEGHPEGRDHEHWMRAKRLIEEGRAEVESPQAAESTPRPVQPGFEDAAPGMVPAMKDEPFEDMQEGAGGRFAEQLSELPESEPAAGRLPTAVEAAARGGRDATGRSVVDEANSPPSAASAPKRRRGGPFATPGR